MTDVPTRPVSFREQLIAAHGAINELCDVIAAEQALSDRLAKALAQAAEVLAIHDETSREATVDVQAALTAHRQARTTHDTRGKQ